MAAQESSKDLTHRSAYSLAEGVRDGQLCAVDVVKAHLSRIEEVNPAVNAVQDLQSASAVEQAQAVDSLPENQRRKLRLAGLPVAVKDLSPAAGFRHTQGSPLFADRVARTDALFVSRMRAAGAVIVGKTNTPEFGLGSHTFNPVYGVTRNPYDLNRTAGGSSGGAAAALASRMLPLADGSDTGGSLRNPASFCNVVGLRPSLGRIPNLPGGGSYSTLSVKGPMGRSVRDTALLMSVLTGADSRDPFSAEDHPADYLQVAESSHGQRLGKKRLRAAWTPDFGGLFPVEKRVREVLAPVVEGLEQAGIDIVEDHPDLSEAAETFRTLRGIQMLGALGDFVAAHPEKIKEDAHWNVQTGRSVTGEQAARAQQGQGLSFQRMAEFLSGDQGQEPGYDVLITPTCQVAPFPVEQRFPRSIEDVSMGDYLEWMTLPSIITVTSHPAISIPVGFTEDGLPVGMQIIGLYRDEAGLLEFAKRIEDVFGTGGDAPSVDYSRAQEPFPEIS